MGLLKLIEDIFLGNNQPKLSQGLKSPIQQFQIQSSEPTEVWHKNSDIISGLQFSATMQLRTPLRVLKRHGKIHSDINSEPEKIAKDEWEGLWIPKLATWRELGIDEDEFEESTIASDIGQIFAADYLPFLISMREVLESNESVDNRIATLKKKSTTKEWKPYITRHGGIDEIINKFFPCFIDTIPKLNQTIIAELSKLGISTANQLEATSDSTLISIEGIGKAKLKLIRDYCASIKFDKNIVRLDTVIR